MQYPYIVYTIVTALYILLFIGPRKAAPLWPYAIVGAMLLSTGTLGLEALKLYDLKANFLLVFGLPLFYIIWGALSGIAFSYYFRCTFIKRSIAIIVFAVATTLMEILVEAVNKAAHLGKFNNWYELAFDALILSLFGFILSNTKNS